MTGRTTILVRGWRSIPHSYAIINQFQCLELLRRRGIKLYFEDAPYFRKKWSATPLMSPEQEAALNAIPPLPADVTPDVEYRIAFPYDLLTPTRARNLVVFGTAEYSSVPDNYIAGNVPLADAHRQAPEAVIVTCSNWSREGFIRSGADPNRVVVVPAGIDPVLFHAPTAHDRAAARKHLGIANDEFVFLSLGNMAGSKGMGLLLHTFAAVLRQHPHVRLVLKGLDTLYSSTRFLQGEVGAIAPQDMQLISPKLSYTGQSLPFAEMPRLYHAADCYVSPYYAEGFNMPVLEAAACGVPVICTAGGSTDDFTTPDFALRIQSTLQDTPGPNGPRARTLIPSPQSLLENMLRVIDDTDFRSRARRTGPPFATEKFAWSHIVDRLLAVLAENR